MLFNAKKFCQDHHIEMSPPGHKHTRPGWVHIRCPFCSGNPGWHGGFNIKEGYYNCWRCGYHWIVKVVVNLLSISYQEAKLIIYNKGYSSEQFRFQKSKTSTRINFKKEISLPPMTQYNLTKQHIDYLLSRRFDPIELKTKWNLMSTGNIGAYSHRILAPIYFRGHMVSYQCRATKIGQNPPYLACAGHDELIKHKDIIYGFDAAIRLNQCIVVEGITDVWRLGYGAVATFGKSFTKAQLLLIANNFKHIFILPDSDVKEEETMTEPLAGLGKEVEEIRLDKGDPGDMRQGDADYLMKTLGF